MQTGEALFHTVKISHPISLKDVESLLCSALEGGSNYWAKIVEEKAPLNFKNTNPSDVKFTHLSYPMNEGGSITIKDDEGKKHKLTLAHLRRGLNRLANNKEYASVFANIVNDNADAADADVFLQFALLGEVIYG